MSAKYTVVRYVPDPIADERVNIGVVAFDGAEIRARFLVDWTRIRTFGAANVQFLQNFASDFQAAADSRDQGLFEKKQIDASSIERFAQRWTNSIQFSEPRSSTSAVGELVEEVAGRFLRPDTPQVRSNYLRRDVRRLHESIMRALKKADPDQARALTHAAGHVQGKIRSHRFDTVVANGKPIIAAHALSFDAAQFSEMENAAQALAWTIKDVSDATNSPSLAVHLTAPSAAREDARARASFMEEMRRAYQVMKAKVFVGNDEALESWAATLIRRTPARHGLAIRSGSSVKRTEVVSVRSIHRVVKPLRRPKIPR